MLTQHTVNRLNEMRLFGMAQAFRQQLEQPCLSDLSFEERFGLLVDHEWTTRQSRLLERLLKKAKLRLPACLEDLDYRPQRGIDPSVMARLSTCSWLERHQNILICGPTGVGKAYLACAFGNTACRHGFSTRYYRVSRLLGDLFAARGDGSYASLLNRLQKIDLLILDDWGLNTYTSKESREILEVVEDRSQRCSTIIASQIPIEHWHECIADPTLADAILEQPEKNDKMNT